MTIGGVFFFGELPFLSFVFFYVVFIETVVESTDRFLLILSLT